MTKTMNAMNLPNVHFVEPNAFDGVKTLIVHHTIAEVIWELATKNPLWQFHAEYGTRQADRTVFACTSFDVKLNGKKLGTISKTNMRRGELGIAIACKRIKDKLERKDVYETKDPKKAIAKVRKEFAPKTTKELMEEAREKAADVVRRVQIEAENKVRRANGVVHSAIQTFYTEGPGVEIYKSHLRADRPEDVVVMEAMDKVAELRAEMMDIVGVKKKMGSTDTALVVLDEGKYLVKILDELQMYNDTTLPQEFRGKLGLLKLVQPNQFVSSAGFRVSDEVFIIDLAQGE